VTLAERAQAALDLAFDDEVKATFSALCERLFADKGVVDPKIETDAALQRLRNAASAHEQMRGMIGRVLS
jgi:hypothetical protein